MMDINQYNNRLGTVLELQCQADRMKNLARYGLTMLKSDLGFLKGKRDRDWEEGFNNFMQVNNNNGPTNVEQVQEVHKLANEVVKKRRRDNRQLIDELEDDLNDYTKRQPLVDIELIEEEVNRYKNEERANWDRDISNEDIQRGLDALQRNFPKTSGEMVELVHFIIRNRDKKHKKQTTNK